MNPIYLSAFALAVAASLAACAAAGPVPGPVPAELTRAESLYADLRSIRDRATSTSRRAEPMLRLPRCAAPTLERTASCAERWSETSAPVTAPIASGGVAAETPACDYDAGAVAAAPNGLDSLRKRIYACYGWTQSHLVVEGDTLDRAPIMGDARVAPTSGAHCL